MRLKDFSSGLIQTAGFAYDYDVVVDWGEIRKRK